MTGAAMLWVGWFGFNAGSAGAADTSAGMAMLVTHLSAATASLVWMIVEWRKTGKPGLVGIVTGTIAGLATITPASGSVGPMGAIVIGASAGFICYYACSIVKEAMGVDDSLDVTAVHGVGGILELFLLFSLEWKEHWVVLESMLQQQENSLSYRHKDAWLRLHLSVSGNLFDCQSHVPLHRWNKSF